MKKTLKCDLCEMTAEGETFEEWMKALQPHYMEVHEDIIKAPTNTKEDMMRWIRENKERFDAA